MSRPRSPRRRELLTQIGVRFDLLLFRGDPREDAEVSEDFADLVWGILAVILLICSIAIPRIRDFRGLKATSFDGRGNYSMGVREQLIFPEIDYDTVDETHGLDITITTSAPTDYEAFELLLGLGMPFAKEGRPVPEGAEESTEEPAAEAAPAAEEAPAEAEAADETTDAAGDGAGDDETDTQEDQA